MDKNIIKDLSKKAYEGRLLGLSAIFQCQSGHIGGAFSVIDILTVLYFHQMKVNPEKPDEENRDRLVVSKGHCTGALYPVLAMKGYFPVEHLKTFRNIESNLSGHVEMKHIPGVDMSAGSLGQGLSAAVGMALAAKADKKDYYVYAIMGDGEIQEGQIWEAAMAAAKYKLNHLIGFVDVNGLQLDGTTEEVMPLLDLKAKWEAFGWAVIEIDGNNIEQIIDGLNKAFNIKDKPIMILAYTIKGKGVSFMENNVSWHGRTPDKEEYKIAVKELEDKIKELGCE